MNHLLSLVTISVALLVTCCFVLSLGCGPQPGNAASAKKTEMADAKGGLPNNRFHRPKQLGPAVARLRELHEAIVAEGPLPEPIKVKVIELIHGSGPSAHSHYHLADDKDHGTHHEEGEKEKVHEYTVDAISELNDIVGWLPRIAGSSDLNENEWNGLKKLSDEFSAELETAFGDSEDVESKRSAYQSVSEAAASNIESIEELVAKNLSRTNG